MIPVLTALVVAAVVVFVALVAGWAYQTANRLDRLHVRYDLSWQALDGALARRAVVARAVAVDAYGDGPDGRRLAALADAAERAPRQAREAAENELSAALARVDPASLPLALVAELAAAGVTAEADGVEALRAEWEDRYGPLPAPVKALLSVARSAMPCADRGALLVPITSSWSAMGWLVPLF